MGKLPIGTVIAALVGVLLCIFGVMYIAEPASGLPSFLPGHGPSVVHHTKHGLLAVGLGVVCFVAAWFLSGPKEKAV